MPSPIIPSSSSISSQVDVCPLRLDIGQPGTLGRTANVGVARRLRPPCSITTPDNTFGTVIERRESGATKRRGTLFGRGHASGWLRRMAASPGAQAHAYWRSRRRRYEPLRDAPAPRATCRREPHVAPDGRHTGARATTTIASSRGPMTGINSGIEVDRRERPKSPQGRQRLRRGEGTRGSPRSRFTVIAHTGNTVARSLAAPGGSRRASTDQDGPRQDQQTDHDQQHPQHAAVLRASANLTGTRCPMRRVRTTRTACSPGRAGKWPAGWRWSGLSAEAPMCGGGSRRPCSIRSRRHRSWCRAHVPLLDEGIARRGGVLRPLPRSHPGVIPCRSALLLAAPAAAAPADTFTEHNVVQVADPTFVGPFGSIRSYQLA